MLSFLRNLIAYHNGYYFKERTHWTVLLSSDHRIQGPYYKNTMVKNDSLEQLEEWIRQIRNYYVYRIDKGKYNFVCLITNTIDIWVSKSWDILNPVQKGDHHAIWIISPPFCWPWLQPVPNSFFPGSCVGISNISKSIQQHTWTGGTTQRALRKPGPVLIEADYILIIWIIRNVSKSGKKLMCMLLYI